MSLNGVFGLNDDGVALLSLLRHWTSVPSSIWSSWNSSDSTPYDGVGIECEGKYNVVYFNLSGYGISGQLAPEIGHLRQLQTIDLSNNNLCGNIRQELGDCSALELSTWTGLVMF
ncbi:receptor-like protein kinase [Pistacia vera]|uniref:receptor-like protein kinase n=1 Tax=Pistacia vera TaxID=55513 RepID=UPI001263CD0F|nr:receptor-like protein kinase [Pistacia vera]